MNDNFDLSDLLVEAPVPAEGASQVRRTAVRRKQRRQAAVGGLGALAFLGLGSVAVLNNDGPGAVYDIQQAGETQITTTTTAAVTTTTTPDPREGLVGLEFNGEGKGVPLGTRLVSLPYFDDVKAGDRRIVLAEDEKGHMAWIVDVRLVATSDYSQPGLYKVLATFQIPEPDRDGNICVNFCAKGDGDVDPRVIVYLRASGAAHDAYRFDLRKLTKSDLDHSGWGFANPTPSEPGVIIPSRPELYKVAASARSEEEVAAYASAGVHIAGSLTVDYNTKGELRWLRDTVENKRVAVYSTPDGVVRDYIVVEDSTANEWTAGVTGQPGGFAYKGGADEMVFMLASYDNGKPTRIDQAWRVDLVSDRIVQIDVKDLKYIPAS